MQPWYGITSILLGLLLFFPIKKVILNLTVNRHEARMKRKITEEELQKLKRKTIILSAIIAMTFAFLYNKVVVLKFYGDIHTP